MHKEALLAKKIISLAKKYSDLHKIGIIEISIPENYPIDLKKLNAIFSSINIKLKVIKGEKLKIIAIEERY